MVGGRFGVVPAAGRRRPAARRAGGGPPGCQGAARVRTSQWTGKNESFFADGDTFMPVCQGNSPKMAGYRSKVILRIKSRGEMVFV